ncbi:hypothetical protein FB451DRAFT_1399660 [Mycena latifolia]|nr:hypothetical protein FB451DRAFT_1399660 [Mycena latifolia]
MLSYAADLGYDGVLNYTPANKEGKQLVRYVPLADGSNKTTLALTWSLDPGRDGNSGGSSDVVCECWESLCVSRPQCLRDQGQVRRAPDKPHEILQVSTAGALSSWITPLVYTVLFITTDIGMSNMVSSYRPSLWYWTGIAALPQWAGTSSTIRAMTYKKRLSRRLTRCAGQLPQTSVFFNATFTLPLFADHVAKFKAGSAACQHIEFVVVAAAPDNDIPYLRFRG